MSRPDLLCSILQHKYKVYQGTEVYCRCLQNTLEKLLLMVAPNWRQSNQSSYVAETAEILTVTLLLSYSDKHVQLA